MSAALKIFLSMSCSGSLLILILLVGKRLWKDSISRQWQYYIWLAVILRLLLPFGSEVSLLGEAYQAVDQAVIRTAPLPGPSGSDSALSVSEPDNEPTDPPAEAPASARPLQDAGVLLTHHLWLIWLAAALGLLIRKITVYQGFIRYIRAGWAPVSDTGMLDQLSVSAERAGVKRPVELYVNPLVSSPLLIGFIHPCIVLPNTNLPPDQFQYIILHELTHYRRRDMLYKWLVQLTVCLHWFNPLVHLMSREITKACEFSCDEAVLVKMGGGHAQSYGKTLLDAMAEVGKYRENPGAVTLSENKQLLKERICAIMDFKKKSTAMRLLTGMLTLCMALGAAFVGVYPVSAAAADPAAPEQLPTSETWKKYTFPTQEPEEENASSEIERYYKAGSVPLFQIAFARLDEKAQSKWLDRIYTDDHILFWGTAVNLLDEDGALVHRYAEKAYADDNIAYFSTLTMHMSEDTLEAWLDQALEDGNWAFQSMLFDKLNRSEEFDKLEEKQEEEWAEAQAAEYRAAGVTVDGKNYYYQGKLVNIFLDIRPNKSFYTLDMNPKGTVNVKIVRNADNQITGVVYMTDAEVTELLSDMSDDDDDWEDPEEDWDDCGIISIPVDLKTVAAGETVFLGEYTLSEGDKIRYSISAETGNRMKIFFAKGRQKDTVYWSVNNLRQPEEPLRCAADFTVGPPGKPGTYKLYLQAPDGALGNVKGGISISQAEAD